MPRDLPPAAPTSSTRRAFLTHAAGLAAVVAFPQLLRASAAEGELLRERNSGGASRFRTLRALESERPLRLSEFTFARLRYDSGDWDYNPKVCANLLDAVLQYTDIPVNEREVVITADSDELGAFPFVFMTGHKLVRFSEAERKGLVRFVENGGLLFSDDCNHDVNGLYAKTFEAEMVKAFGPNPMPKLAKNHALYTSFFEFPDGPPRTSHELNGWGDNVVHDYLRGTERHGRLGVLYSNKDYGCEWDYDWKNKRFRRRDNARFGVNVVVYAMT